MKRSFKPLLIFSIFLIETSFSVTAIADTKEERQADQRAVNAAVQSQLPATQTLKPMNFDSVLYPIKSDFSEGEVTTHALEYPLPISFFVIGDDQVSLQWVEDRKDILKSAHATGFLTNVDSKERLEGLEEALSMKLTPANLEGLEELVHTDRHYPFLVNGKEVVQ